MSDGRQYKEHLEGYILELRKETTRRMLHAMIDDPAFAGIGQLVAALEALVEKGIFERDDGLVARSQLELHMPRIHERRDPMSALKEWGFSESQIQTFIRLIAEQRQ